MNKPSQITDRNADKNNKKQWIPPTVEVIGANNIGSGTLHHSHTEAFVKAAGSPASVTKYFIS